MTKKEKEVYAFSFLGSVIGLTLLEICYQGAPWYYWSITFVIIWAGPTLYYKVPILVNWTAPAYVISRLTAFTIKWLLAATLVVSCARTTRTWPYEWDTPIVINGKEYFFYEDSVILNGKKYEGTWMTPGSFMTSPDSLGAQKIIEVSKNFVGVRTSNITWTREYEFKSR